MSHAISHLIQKTVHRIKHFLLSFVISLIYITLFHKIECFNVAMTLFQRNKLLFTALIYLKEGSFQTKFWVLFKGPSQNSS